MLQDQIGLQNQELNDLTKRNQQLLDQWTRVDVECGRVTEDLHVTSGRVEQLRSECANLRAEKGIWEVRLVHSHVRNVVLSNSEYPKSPSRREQELGVGTFSPFRLDEQCSKDA